MNAGESDRNRTKPSIGNAAVLSVSPPGKEAKNDSGPSSEYVISDVESSSSASTSRSDADSSDELDEDGDPPPTLIHETLQKDQASKLAGGKAKYAPSDETKERRDARTIFIGNLAPDVAIKRVSRGDVTSIFIDDTPGSPCKNDYIGIYSLLSLLPRLNPPASAQWHSMHPLRRNPPKRATR